MGTLNDEILKEKLTYEKQVQTKEIHILQNLNRTRTSLNTSECENRSYVKQQYRIHHWEHKIPWKLSGVNIVSWCSAWRKRRSKLCQHLRQLDATKLLPEDYETKAKEYHNKHRVTWEWKPIKTKNLITDFRINRFWLKKQSWIPTIRLSLTNYMMNLIWQQVWR